MSYSLDWLPKVLLEAGLKVAEVPGWQTRGRGDMGRVFGVLCHHTAGPRDHNMPSLTTLIEGRRNLKGPLAQLGLGRDGTFYVIAAGKANHAGEGVWLGVRGNRHFIGIEAENTGKPDDSPWPQVQMDAYQRGVSAILRHLGLSAERCAGHIEYAEPRGRKVDPSFDMSAFRTVVAALTRGEALPPTLIPRTEPNSSGRPTVRRGDSNDWVRDVQKSLGYSASGVFDAVTEAGVRRFQRQHQLVPDGIVGPKTWSILDLGPTARTG